MPLGVHRVGRRQVGQSMRTPRRLVRLGAADEHNDAARSSRHSLQKRWSQGRKTTVLGSSSSRQMLHSSGTSSSSSSLGSGSLAFLRLACSPPPPEKDEDEDEDDEDDDDEGLLSGTEVLGRFPDFFFCFAFERLHAPEAPWPREDLGAWPGP